MWKLRGYGPDGVFVSETSDGLYAECWPSDALRKVWGNTQTFLGYDLHPYYAFIAPFGSLVVVRDGSSQIAFGSLEECMKVAEKVISDDDERRRHQSRDRAFTP